MFGGHEGAPASGSTFGAKLHGPSGDAMSVLSARADSLAAEEIEEDLGDRISLLLFRIGEEHYAIRVEDVREIFQEYVVTSIPGVPNYILGVINVRGEIISVTDPASLMGLGSTDVAVFPQPPAIVVKDEDRVTALVVDAIDDIAEVSAEEIEPPVTTIDRRQAEFVSGSIFHENIMVGLIHTDRLLQPIVMGRSQ